MWGETNGGLCLVSKVCYDSSGAMCHLWAKKGLKLSLVISFVLPGRKGRRVTFINLCFAVRQIRGGQKAILLLLSCLQLKSPYMKGAYLG